MPVLRRYMPARRAACHAYMSTSAIANYTEVLKIDPKNYVALQVGGTAKCNHCDHLSSDTLLSAVMMGGPPEHR